MVRRLTFLTVLVCTSTLLRAQNLDEDIAILPPMPNLYLGDPERELSPRMKRALAREEERKRRAAAEELKGMEPYGVEKEPERKVFKKSVLKKREPVHNSISSIENATTNDGTRLRPFGEPDYWGGIPDVQEDNLVELAPMPDLRVPEQVTKREKWRDKRVANAKERHLANEEARAKREEKRQHEVRTSQSDPSLALVHVHSSRGAPYSGVHDAPSTSSSTLKPFNENSAYYRDGMLMSHGSAKRDPNRFRLFKKKSD